MREPKMVASRSLALYRLSIAVRRGVVLLSILSGEQALAGSYEFVPAPQTDLNRMYRIDKLTGEVGACQYGQKDGSYGVTLCYAPGEGAGPLEPSDYGLVASRHDHEASVFRVDYRTGAMSICYVFEDHVVCTRPETGLKP